MCIWWLRDMSRAFAPISVPPVLSNLCILVATSGLEIRRPNTPEVYVEKTSQKEVSETRVIEPVRYTSICTRGHQIVESSTEIVTISCRRWWKWSILYRNVRQRRTRDALKIDWGRMGGGELPQIFQVTLLWRHVVSFVVLPDLKKN